MKKAERRPRYEPFRNRTPLVCQDEEAALFENGIGTICHPCGLRCEGKFFVENFGTDFYSNLEVSDGKLIKSVIIVRIITVQLVAPTVMSKADLILTIRQTLMSRKSTSIFATPYGRNTTLLSYLLVKSTRTLTS